MAKKVTVTADKMKRQKRLGRIIRLALLIFLLLLIVIYVVLRVIYNEGSFTILLGKGAFDNGIAIYDSPSSPQAKRELEATPVSNMDNISWKWLPENIDTEADGAHNGENYLAYTFYIENRGKDVLEYWYEISVDEVIKNVDEAIRIMIYKNGEKKVFAKLSQYGEPEIDTIPFITDKGDTIVLESSGNFEPGKIDRYTIVIYLEGDDPDCTDPLKGGAMKMHMLITEVRMGE